MRTIILITHPSNPPETWGNLKKVCNAKGWSYHGVQGGGLPAIRDGWKIERLPLL